MEAKLPSQRAISSISSSDAKEIGGSFPSYEKRQSETLSYCDEPNQNLSRRKPKQYRIAWASVVLLLLTANLQCPVASAQIFVKTKATTTPSSLATKKPSSLYRWGNFGYVPEPAPLPQLVRHKARKWVEDSRNELEKRWVDFCKNLTISKVFGLALRGARAWVFWFFSRDALASIYEDRWHAERDPDAFFGSEGMWISKGAHKSVVRRRIQRSKRNRQWVGLGYTPRLVWLVAVVLRGTFQCTAIPKVFNPSLTGWGAGTVLGAKCTHQEWIATFMLGWFGSEHYWKYLFGIKGPPYHQPGTAFPGVPVFITKLRIL